MSSERGSEVEVRIRPFRPDDWPAVHRWFNNREAISSLMEVRPSFAEENAKGWTDAAVGADGEDRKWAIEVEGQATIQSASPLSTGCSARPLPSSAR